MNYSMLRDLMKLLRTICKLLNTLPMLEQQCRTYLVVLEPIYTECSIKLRLTLLTVNGYHLAKTSKE